LFIGVISAALALGVGGGWYVMSPGKSADALSGETGTKTPPQPVVVAPTSVTVTLTAEPAGAKISSGGSVLTCNPCKLSGSVGSRQLVKVSAEGMVETSVDVIFDQDRSEKIVLASAPATALVPTPVIEAAVDAGKPLKKKKPTGLSVDEKNPYQ
jgi:hypothetical protein